MTTTQMEVFISVCETCNMTETSRQMSYSQSNISGIIHELEEEYQTTFFVRNGKRLSLTEQGLLFYQYCKESIIREKRIMERLNNRAIKEVRIGLFLSVGAIVLPVLLQSLQDAFPRISFKYVVRNKAMVLDLWSKGKIDIMVCDGHIRDISYEGKLLYQDNCRFYKLAESTIPDQLSPLDLRLQPMLLRERGSSVREQFDEAIHKMGVDIEPYVESVSNDLIMRMVMAGVGISIFPTKIIEKLVKRNILSPILIPGMEFQWSFFLYLQKNLHGDAVIGQVVELIESNFDDWMEGQVLNSYLNGQGVE